MFCIFFQPEYVIAKSPDPYPPVFDKYLDKVAPTIGAEVKWEEVGEAIYSNFAWTGKSVVFDTLGFPYLYTS